MTKEVKYIGGAFLIGIIYRLLMGLQGIELTDFGFFMTFYQNIFTHPDAMPFYFNYYLTGVVGGVWYQLFSQFGLLGFYLLETLTLAAAIGLSYCAFRPWLTSNRVAAIAVLLSFLFPSSISTFHYNTFSFLLVAASVYAITRWHQNNQAIWLVVAGMFIGICFFARLLNVTFAALAVIPFVRGCHVSVKQAFVNLFTYMCGIFVGCLLVCGLMRVLGHWSYFVDALHQNSLIYGSHTAIGLFGIYMKGYLNIALQIVAIVFIAWTYGDVGHLPKVFKVTIRTLLLIVLFVLVLTSLPYLSAVAVCTLLLVTTRRFSHLAFYPLLCAYLFPLGSSDGISATFLWCGGLLIIPTACCYSRLVSKWQRNVVCALCLTIGVLMVYRMGVRVYATAKQPVTESIQTARKNGNMEICKTAHS